MKLQNYIYIRGKMRAQSSVLVAVVVITIMMVGWIFGMYSQTSLQKMSLTEIALTKISKHLDLIKGFSKNALIMATHKGTSLVGGEGITFYCNMPTPPTVKQIRFELSNQTLGSLNSYINKYEIPDPLLVIDVDEFSCVDNPVEDYKLSSGLYDENFSSNAYGSKIKISLEENNVSSKNEFLELIPENRFWFLYRNLRDWALYYGNVYKNRICFCLETYSGSCPSEISSISCRECPELQQCILEQIDETAKDMEEIFDDEFITCVGKPTCCYAKRSDPCQSRDAGCPEWVGGVCSYCNLLGNEELCIEGIQASSIEGFSSSQEHELLRFEAYSHESSLSPELVFSDGEEVCAGNCIFWETGFITLKTLFTCTDEKYEISIPPLGDRYLRFSIDTLISMKRSGINYQVVPCVGTPPSCYCPGWVPPNCPADCYVIVTTIPPAPPPTTAPPTTAPPTTVPTTVPPITTIRTTIPQPD